MPQTADAPKRYRANTPLSVEPRGQAPIRFAAGEECKGAPEGWPPKWLIEQGYVEEITDEKGTG